MVNATEYLRAWEYNALKEYGREISKQIKIICFVKKQNTTEKETEKCTQI